MPEESSNEASYELRYNRAGTRDLVAKRKLTPADFDSVRREVGMALLNARKVGFVSARQADKEERITTTWNGKESSDTARPGDWIVTNMSPERKVLQDKDGRVNTYVIRAETFPRLYDADEGSTSFGKIYRSKSVVEAFLLPGAFEIVAPWDEIQRGDQGYLINNGKEVYGNNRETFEATYEVSPGQ